MGDAVSMVSFFGSDAESVEKRDALGVHYLGLSLVLAWFYCLWFSPSVFVCLPLMGRAMVYSWLASLAFSALAFLVMPLALRRMSSVCACRIRPMRPTEVRWPRPAQWGIRPK